MELALMRFKGFTLRYNPLSVEVTSKKSKAVYTLPFSGEAIRDMGERCRIIKGKGVLKGADCIEQYASLKALQSEQGAGILSLAGLPPVKSYFTELTAFADATPDTVSYSFEFTEASSESSLSPFYKEHRVKSGETLYDIADKYGVGVDVLVKLNTKIRRPDELEEGESIKLC